jgi:hypothetical protein
MMQFGSFRASSLYCAQCGDAQPVREKLVKTLPDKEIYDYLCTHCGTKVGNRQVSIPSNLVDEMAPEPARIKIL